MEELIGIYKGLRMPLLGVVLILLAAYVYWPSRKKDLEQARFNMLDDDVDHDLSKKFTSKPDKQ
ncbi:MAG TPA: cbb3-type cytochrome c oxidase subunit 3 [Leptospiraceae bacterium]|jgi:cbb3-type cytochrome oxidase subunit 3|nr:cbb3-type cytochrome c oxidase subunit 3 [Leptospirales bacterium]HMU82936.1 cbb3-type cytochrome c oxidase subunit 3 [Leptospiraceae bacterium]HMW61044.1 cbb3-type cytochrome c oxidase subunit 3 [Leptospiraceae bacterium]HMX56487.1 cbb3-type cytochrome c oxidase subunit 3 [Leptospiraceae bacterium]HMY44510.1 cbb3-type cytochrome c oxidase subunit 3 [Leptospiraceae bacterium]